MTPACQGIQGQKFFVPEVRETGGMSQTTNRVLQLLGLLQSRRVWSGTELGERLASRAAACVVTWSGCVNSATWHASPGHGGGYQLGAGAVLPPLLLDAGRGRGRGGGPASGRRNNVAGVVESALRALSKLDQVMPPRLRSQVAAVRDNTVTLTAADAEPVAPEVLMTLARACRDHEHVDARYTARSGVTSQRRLGALPVGDDRPALVPARLDRDRDDWRTLRLDRMSQVRARGQHRSPPVLRPTPRRSSAVR